MPLHPGGMPEGEGTPACVCFWHPCRGAGRSAPSTGGRYCAATPGYHLATLRVAPRGCRPARLQQRRNDVMELREQGRGIREIARELSLTQIRPLDREDVHELNMALAGSFGAIKGISTRIGLYEFRQIPGAARELAANLSEMSERLQSMVEILNRGLRVEEQSREIEAIRAESDHFLVVGLGELYESQAAGVAELLETIKWSQLYDRLEDATERTQQVANVLESIVQKNL